MSKLLAHLPTPAIINQGLDVTNLLAHRIRVVQTAFDEFTRTVATNSGAGGGGGTTAWGQTDSLGFYWYAFSEVIGATVEWAVAPGDATMHLAGGVLGGRPSYVSGGAVKAVLGIDFDNMPFNWGSFTAKFSLTGLLTFPVDASDATINLTRLKIRSWDSDTYVTFYPETGHVEINGRFELLTTADGTDVGPFSDGDQWWVEMQFPEGGPFKVRYWLDGVGSPGSFFTATIGSDNPQLLAPEFHLVQEQPDAQAAYIDRSTTLHVHEVHLFDPDGNEILGQKLP